MFDKHKDTSAQGAPDRGTEAMGLSEGAVIGPSMEITAEITASEDLVVEGKLKGSLQLPEYDLVIRQSGRVIGDVQARNVRVEGQLAGDVTGSQAVVITGSGRMLGNIACPRVSLEDGSEFKGRIDMERWEGEHASTASTAAPALTVMTSGDG